MQAVFFSVLTVAALSVVSAANAATWQLDPSHMRVGFAVDHLGYSTVHGQFNKVDGRIQYDSAKPAATTVEANIDTASLDTGWDARDEHLRKAEFFDSATHPVMTFKSTGIRWHGKNRATLSGNLTLRGVTRPVQMDVRINKHAASPITKKDTIGFRATTTINRSDFGMTAYVPAITNRVPVTIDAEMIPVAAP